MKYSPQHIACMYDMLRQIPPFDKWGLPSSDWVSFEIPKRKDVLGEFIEVTGAAKPYTIKISSISHDHLFTIMQTLAHEMVHLAQSVKNTDNTSQHNLDFRKRSRSVCSIFGWDYKFFVGS